MILKKKELLNRRWRKPFQWIQKGAIQLVFHRCWFNLSDFNCSTVTLTSDLESSNSFLIWYGFLLIFFCNFLKSLLLFLCFSERQKFLILFFIGSSSSLRLAYSWGSIVEKIWVRSRSCCLVRLIDCKVRPVKNNVRIIFSQIIIHLVL